MNGIGGGGDAGANEISVARKTRFLSEADSVNFMNGINRGTIRYRRTNGVSFNIEAQWSDELSSSTASVNLKADSGAGGNAYYGGTYYYSGPVYYNASDSTTGLLSHINFSLVGRGLGATLTFSATSTRNYEVQKVEIP